MHIIITADSDIDISKSPINDNNKESPKIAITSNGVTFDSNIIEDDDEDDMTKYFSKLGS